MMSENVIGWNNLVLYMICKVHMTKERNKEKTTNHSSDVIPFDTFIFMGVGFCSYKPHVTSQARV